MTVKFMPGSDGLGLFYGGSTGQLPSKFGATMGNLFGGAGGFGSLLGGLGSLFGGAASAREQQRLVRDIGKQGEFQNMGFGGFGGFGNITEGSSQFNFDPMLQAQRAMLGGMAPGLLGGGLFNDPALQQALGATDLAGAMNQVNQGAQLGLQTIDPSQYGAIAQGGMDMQNLLLGQAAGPIAGFQDFSGGLGGQLRSAGIQNQLAAGDFTGLQNAELASLRAAAQPQMDRQFNRLQDRLFATGQLGSTGGGEQLRGLFEAQGQQDLNFQNEAFGRAMQRGGFLSNLGLQQTGQAGNVFGQNLGAMQALRGQDINRNLGFAGMASQLTPHIMNTQMGGLDSIFNQGAQAQQFQRQGGLGRLQAAQGLMGFGTDLFSQQLGLGLGAQQGLMDMSRFGLDTILGMRGAQNDLIGARGDIAQAQATALGHGGSGGGMGGFLGSALGAIGGLFSDARLKDNITKVGEYMGHNIYAWTWNAEGVRVGADKQPPVGVIAQEHMEHTTERDGYLMVDYSEIF